MRSMTFEWQLVHFIQSILCIIFFVWVHHPLSTHFDFDVSRNHHWPPLTNWINMKKFSYVDYQRFESFIWIPRRKFFHHPWVLSFLLEIHQRGMPPDNHTHFISTCIMQVFFLFIFWLLWVPIEIVIKWKKQQWEKKIHPWHDNYWAENLNDPTVT